MGVSVTLYVFNPEHDLCLANGDANYVPPSSSLDFARSGSGVMRMLYGDDAVVVAADDYGAWRADNKDVCVERIVPWGWDMRLKHTLLKQGAASELMPSDMYLSRLRDMQHRTTILSLQPHAFIVHSSSDVVELLQKQPRLVLKAPWSGSGRGLRWIDGVLSSHDEAWIAKTVAAQRCVVAEERLEVVDNFAFEFRVMNGMVNMVGLSLFVTQSGVYRHNVLLSDDAIRRRVGITSELEKALHHWLQLNIVPYYNGYLGIDLLRTVDGTLAVSEINLRHTMGLVAHRCLQRHPDWYGRIWKPEDVCHE